MDERKYAVSTFRSRQDIHPSQYDATWGELSETLTAHKPYQSKHDVWLWSPTRYRDGMTRGRDGVEQVSLFVADIDDGTSGEEMSARMNLLGVSYVVVSTWSHTPEHPKLRVVMPLEKPIPAVIYDDVWQRLNVHIFSSLIDPSTKDPSRMYYGPSCPAERLEHVYVGRL